MDEATKTVEAVRRARALVEAGWPVHLVGAALMAQGFPDGAVQAAVAAVAPQRRAS